MVNAKSIITSIDARRESDILETRSSKEAEREFSEWASLFGENVFVSLILYADESGTHGEKNPELPGGGVPVIGGYIDYKDNWTRFCGAWKAVLDSYGVDYFHYREWRAIVEANKHNKPATPELLKNPYYGKSNDDMHGMLYDLA